MDWSHQSKGAMMYRSAFSSFAALAIALTLTFPILSNAERDNDDATEAGAENSHPTEEPRGSDAMPDLASPTDDPMPSEMPLDERAGQPAPPPDAGSPPPDAAAPENGTKK